MMPRAATPITAAVVFLAMARVAAAALPLVANGTDDICLPTADPCVIDRPTTIVAPGDFDFGLRSVQIVPGGSIETTWATLRCGEFIVNADDKDVAIRLPDTALDQAYLTVTA
ncbi:MAG: hypothetical protein HY899_18175, partial [Deltaproteobacteria bacterium]|nr:hypothetical protein [Deltaproteobacteria bacterium]